MQRTGVTEDDQLTMSRFKKQTLRIALAVALLTAIVASGIAGSQVRERVMAQSDDLILPQTQAEASPR